MEDNNIDWRHFEKVAMHVGTILEAQEFPEARKPAYKLTIDFGTVLGIKKSSAQITEQYKLEDLVGKKVVAVTNFPPKQIGPFMSECLVLGTYSTDGVKLITPDPTSENGDRIG